ncbi:MAG: type II/IV secretion system ATPase subunit, partial [Thermoplasmata archaeon]|nr:type II/IV secretion system ATPase subunit [Thermoplasmata archaeon]
MIVLEGKSNFQSPGKEDIEKKIKEMEKFIDEHLPRRLSRETKSEKTSEKIPSKEDIEKKIKEMEKFIDEHLSKRIPSKEIKPETISTHPKIEELIKQRPVEGQKGKNDEGTPSKSLAIENILEKEEERIRKEQIENKLNEEEVIEHVLFDEEDPFFLEETGIEAPSREYINDVELPKESLRFKPHVEFRPPEETGQINIPVKGEEFEEIDFYPIEEPFAYVKILREKETFEKVYLLIEPELTEEESKVLNFLEETISSTVVPEIAKIEDAKRYLEREVEYIINDYGISLPTTSKHKIIYMLKRDFLGFGKIDALMKDPDIEDISCDGAGLPVFIYHRKHGSLKTNVVFDNEEELSSFVMRLAQKCGKHVSLADPLLDATLPDGSRVQLTLGEEVTTKGSTFTIRKFRSTPFSPIELVKMNTLSPEMLAYLWLAVEHGASGIFAGGTASGKTTTLNAISLFIPKEAKIVSIEETREINLPHPN